MRRKGNTKENECSGNNSNGRDSQSSGESESSNAKNADGTVKDTPTTIAGDITETLGLEYLVFFEKHSNVTPADFKETDTQ